MKLFNLNSELVSQYPIACTEIYLSDDNCDFFKKKEVIQVQFIHLFLIQSPEDKVKTEVVIFSDLSDFNDIAYFV